MRIKTYSQIKPEKNFIIENIRNGRCTVLFFDNIEEIKQDDVETPIQYAYDLYRSDIQYRDGLQNEIENNYSLWLDFIKSSDYNTEAIKIREIRDKLLADTDWTQMGDTALSIEKQEKYKKYRQYLRDITKQEGFPYTVEFPILESEE